MGKLTMGTQVKRFYGSGFLMFGLACAAGPVHAQDAPANTGQGTVSVLMEEVTVTARRREESLDDLPQSVTAFTAEGMQVRGADRIDALGKLTPNLTFQNNPSFGGSSNSASVYIRGKTY